MRYVSAGKRHQVLERDGYRCVYCSADLRTEPLAIDHKVPVSAGGTNDVRQPSGGLSKLQTHGKKGFTSSDGDIRKYLDRRRGIDRISDKVGDCPPADSRKPGVGPIQKMRPVPWCGGACQSRQGEKRMWVSDDKTHHLRCRNFHHAFVWRCTPCRRYFTVSNGWYSGLSEFKYTLESVIWGRAHFAPGKDAATSIVAAIMSDSDTQTIRSLVASWAGEIVEVKRLRHAHGGNGASWEPSSCWCEHGLPGFEATDRTYEQT